MKTDMLFDFIGDIHGHAVLLERLLDRLGYAETGGTWRHSDRQAVFVGDFIDRGPAIPETLRIVRAMVEGGSAAAVMGNHEWDALRFHHCPAHHSHLRDQLKQTLLQFEGRDAEWKSHLRWLRSLPLWLDNGSFRVVHACWNQAAVATLSGVVSPLTDEVLSLSKTQSPEVLAAMELLLNGWRLQLPGDLFVTTSRGMPMNWMRAKWWIPAAGRHYEDLTFPDVEACPHCPIEIPAHEVRNPTGVFAGYPAEAPPVFVGHYSLPKDRKPAPIAANVACLDYSAAFSGPLVAYRWDGEKVLSADKFVSIHYHD